MGKKYKKTFKLLKKLCNRNLVFFRIKQLETGDDLTRENLVQALKMSDRAPKHHLEMLANLMIKKCNEFRAKISTKISFKEYEKMIINRVRFVV